MLKSFAYLIILTFTFGCNQPAKEEEKEAVDRSNTIRMYAKEIRDSFSVSVSLPESYDPKNKQRYPVAFVLDANFHFGMLAAAVRKYEEIGVLPPLVLVGVGYADLGSMDSLRNRDYTFPVAIPEYEMVVSGGADKFLKFVSAELVPYIDRHYTTDTNNRGILGHSLGGYFVAYAMTEDLAGTNSPFSSYIAASPSLHYNHYYLMDRIKALAPSQRTGRMINTYLTYGGLEDEEDADDTTLLKNEIIIHELAKHLGQKQQKALVFKADLYTGLGHLDTPIPTFVKGLQYILSDE